MRRRASWRLRAYCALSAAALLGGLASGRPQLVAIAAPFLVFLTAALGLARETRVSVDVATLRNRVLEGEPIPIALTLTAGSRCVEIELRLVGATRSHRLRLGASERRALEVSARAPRWGVRAVAVGRVRAWDRFGLFAWDGSLVTEPVRVYPRPERLRALIAPHQTQLLAGNRVARSRGDGVEFADIRPFAPGDRVRRVNWRATARRGALHVNEQHPERNADVILFLDTFEHARWGQAGTLDLAVRAAAALAGAHLERRDRVGVVSFGGVLHWLEPTLGQRALYRIADALLQTEIVFSYVWRTVSAIPTRLLPPGALVIALTPLLDPRSAQALLDLRARGYDLAIVECSPEPFLPAPGSVTEELARRLWQLQRAALRTRFRELGVFVGEWQAADSLSMPIGEVIRSRRRARPIARA